MPRTTPGLFELLARWFAVAAGAVLFITLVAYLGRAGYTDAADNGVSFLDARYAK